MESHSDDGGKHWSNPQEISGSDRTLCTFQTEGKAGECDEDQASVPTVGPDGTVYVGFMNSQNPTLWEPGEEFDDQYLVVSSSDGGKHWSKPSFAAGLEDGSRDYPINVDGRQTLTGYQVRVWGAGNIVADPKRTGGCSWSSRTTATAPTTRTTPSRTRTSPSSARRTAANTGRRRRSSTRARATSGSRGPTSTR